MRKLWLVLILFSTLSSAQTVYQTSDIALLDNRFRVDYGIKQITFIIARKRFSEAVILVRPDGSKAYSWTASERTHWLEGKDHDIITIDDPMPGPWQALGDIDGDNRIQLLSDVQLQVQHLPIQLYSGERIKVSGALYHNSTQLDAAYLNGTSLTMVAYGYNRPEDDNFEFTSRELSKFNDLGERYDEMPADGIFTALVPLELTTGKYRFEVAVKNNVFSRNFNQDVVVFPRPIKTHMLSLLDGADPTLKFDFDEDELKPASIAIKGRVISANGTAAEEFIIYGKTGMDHYLHTFARPVSGSYQIELELFATTRLGREIIIKMDPQAFVIPIPLVVNLNLVVTEEALQGAALKEAANAEPEFNWLHWLIGGLLGVVILAVVALLGIKFWQKRKFGKVIAEKPQSESEQTPGSVSSSDTATELDLNTLSDTK
ncbi:MAG: hypothetical protein ACI86X_002236 [Moritella sp.]|jgi:uncharacterized protein (TIGR03503 family)